MCFLNSETFALTLSGAIMLFAAPAQAMPRAAQDSAQVYISNQIGPIVMVHNHHQPPTVRVMKGGWTIKLKKAIEKLE